MHGLEKIIFTRFVNANRVINPVFYDRKAPVRKMHGICFCLSGKIVYKQGGKEYICDPDHVVFIARGAEYTTSCVEAGEFPLINFYTTDDFAPTDFFTLEVGEHEKYMRDFDKLGQLALLRPVDGRLQAMRILYDILLRLCKAEFATQSRTFRIISPAVRYLETHFFDPEISNRVLAEQAMISEVYFRRLFKENFGVSPKKYIHNLRIEQAKNLLKSNSFLSVAQIAEEVGFTSIYQFSAAFKKATGFSPTEYISYADSFER